MKRRALLSLAAGSILTGCSTHSGDSNTSIESTTQSNSSQYTTEMRVDNNHTDEMARIVDIEDQQLQDAGLNIEVSVDNNATQYSPAMIRATLRNESEETIGVVFDAVAPLGNAIESDNESLFLAPQRLDMADKTTNQNRCGFTPPEREGRCWQSQETIATMDRLTGYTLNPGGAISNVHDLLVSESSPCPSEGEYEFSDSRLQYERPNDEQRNSVEWGFTVYYPGPSR